MQHRQLTRRRFIQSAALAVAGPAIIKATALGAEGKPPPSERIVMATIGTGGRGTGDMDNFLTFPEVQMVAVCDVVAAHRERAQKIVNGKYKNNDCKAYVDFREVNARKDIDAVLIGTPDHWHALITIDACRNGKDVYCEKPECLTIREGRAMVDAARRYGRVVSGGSQRVLGDYGNWPRLIRSGALGTIKEVYASCGGPSHDCFLPAEATPAGVDWDMWLGPAPWRPFHSSLIKGGFRPWRDYSGGGMTDWGAHRFGAAMFATGVHETGPVEIIPPNGKDVPRLTFVFANGMKMYHAASGNITYKGTDGELPGKEIKPSGPMPFVGYQGRGIFGDFLACVRSRQRPFRDIEIGHRAASVCHLGNIAYWLNRPLKWDPVKEDFVGDATASRWLDRPKRGNWVL